MTNQTYAEKNQWYITASKLKVFAKDPFLYDLMYNKLVNEEQEDKRCFVTWTAFHHIMEFWTEEFLKKYYIDEWLVKTKLQEKVLEFHWDRTEEQKKAFKKCLLPEVRAEYLKITGNDWKIQLTPAEWRDILWMYQQALEQPIRDLWSDYIREHRLIAKYKNLKLSAQLDRRWVVDSGGKRYSLEEINWLLLWKTRDEQRSVIHKLWLKSYIRDFKTSWDISRMKRELRYWDTTKDYILSMSFYYCIVYVIYGLESKVYLDVIEKSAPYVSDTLQLADYILQDSLQTKIKPLLETIIECEQRGIYPARTREDRLEDSKSKLYIKYHPEFKQTVPSILELDMA